MPICNLVSMMPLLNEPLTSSYTCTHSIQVCYSKCCQYSKSNTFHHVCPTFCTIKISTNYHTAQHIMSVHRPQFTKHCHKHLIVSITHYKTLSQTSYREYNPLQCMLDSVNSPDNHMYIKCSSNHRYQNIFGRSLKYWRWSSNAFLQSTRSMPSTHRINRAFSVKSSLEQDISPINWKIEPTSSKGSIKEVLMLTEHPV